MQLEGIGRPQEARQAALPGTHSPPVFSRSAGRFVLSWRRSLGGEVVEEVLERLFLLVFGPLHRLDVRLVLLDLRLLLIEFVQVTLVRRGGGRQDA